MKKKLVIGLVGEKGSGKETFGKYLKEIMDSRLRGNDRIEEFSRSARKKIIEHIRFSDLLKETLTLWDLPSTRKNLQDLAVFMEEGFGAGTLAHALFIRINKMKADIVLLDGVRWEADVKLLEQFPKHLLVYITADLQTRFERIKKRVEKMGEGADYQQFLKEEKAKNELLIPKLGKNADFKIVNNGSLKEFKNQIEQFVTNFLN